jgi:hypothetical protein
LCGDAESLTKRGHRIGIFRWRRAESGWQNPARCVSIFKAQIAYSCAIILRGVSPVVCTPHSVRFEVRSAPSSLIWAWILVVAMAAGASLCAQTASVTNPQGAPAAVEIPSAPGGAQSVAPNGDVDAAGSVRIARRDALLGLAQWDHSLLGAFEFSARLVKIAKFASVPAEPRPLPAPVARLSTSGTRPSINSLIASLNSTSCSARA